MKTKPNEPINPNGAGCDCLTKREYFAAAALQGLLASGDVITFKDVVRQAVKISDVLIEQLNEEEIK